MKREKIMSKKILTLILGIISVNLAYAQSDQDYWCKYTNSCNTNNQPKVNNVPQQDPYSTPTYNDGGPTDIQNNGAPYYDPYSSPTEVEVVPSYGEPIIGVGTVYEPEINRQNNTNFNTKINR